MDTLTKEQRRRAMQGNKSSGTKPELAMLAALWRAGFIGPDIASTTKELPGRPDFLIKGRLCVFVNGCYWHCCPRHWKEPADAGWAEKFRRNRVRDARVRRQLRRLGYRTIVVWEHDLKTEQAADRAASRVKRKVEK